MQPNSSSTGIAGSITYKAMLSTYQYMYICISEHVWTTFQYTCNQDQ